MDNKKESGLATGLRIAFAIIGTFLIMLCSTCAALHFTILNDTFWVDFTKSEEFREYLIDQLDISENTLILNRDENVTVTFTDPDTKEEFLDIIIDDLVDIVLEGRVDFDADKYEDFFEDHEEELFGDQRLTSTEQREQIHVFLEDLEDEMDEFSDEYKDSEGFGAIAAYNKASKECLITAIVSGFFVVVMTVVLIVIHKNKFRPIRAMGIAATTAGALNAIGAFVVAVIFSVGADTLKDEDDALWMLLDTLKEHTATMLIIMVCVLIGGVIMIIAGAVGASSANKAAIE